MPWGKRVGTRQSRMGEFAARLTESTNFLAGNGCFEWTGTLLNSKYGVVAAGDRSKKTGRSSLAHRVSYEVHFGQIEKGHEIHHLCRNSLCLNPMHLQSMTKKEHATISANQRWSDRTEEQ